jgi:hypothetical protein
MNATVQGWGVWLALSAACLGTYACRALGVKLSGHIDSESEIFRWVAAVTYAMVAALTVRMLLMPLGLLATVPMLLRISMCVVSLAVMSRPTRRMGPALLIGTLLMLGYGVVRTA